MNIEKLNFLRLDKHPARVTAEQAGWLLGFAEHDMTVLIRAKLLKPLGHPPQNGIKYFSIHELEQLREDTNWLSRASDATVRHWRIQNSRKQGLATQAKLEPVSCDSEEEK